MMVHLPVFLTRDTPTWFQFMQSRYEECLLISKGLHSPGAAGQDNTALLVFVPFVSKILHVSIAAAYDLIMGAFLGLSTLVGALAIHKWSLRVVFFFFAAVGITAIASDAYAFQAFPAIAGIPWLVRFAKDKKRFAIVAIALALFAGFCDLMRYGAGMPYIAMIVIMAFFCYPKIKATAVAAIVVGLYLLPGAWLNRTYPLHHPVWHSVYAGFGWIPNSKVPINDDHSSDVKARSVDPNLTYMSPHYEAILRNEVLKMVTQEPGIVAVNVLAKLATILLILAVLLVPVWRHLRFDLSFAAAIALGMLPGILVSPNFRYILAGICCACFFAVRTAIGSAPGSSAAQA